MPEEETSLETVAENLSDIEAEAGVDAYGEPYSEEETIDYYAEASKAVDLAVLQSLEEKYLVNQESKPETISLIQQFQEEPELSQVIAAPASRTGNPTMKKELAYKLNISGSEYYVWFPSGSELEVTDDGYIYNATGANLVGIISDNLSGVSLDSYNDTLTIAPLLNGSGNNNAYRYGSRCYLTDYYQGTTGLQSNVTYVTGVQLVDKPSPGYGFSRFQIALLFVLGVLALITIIRGLWRDK